MTAAVDYNAADLLLLERVETAHFWFRARRRILLEALARWFPQAQTYLEVGAGTGYNVQGIAEAFPSWRIFASDPLQEGITLAGAKTTSRPVTLVQCDARGVPFQEQFDVIGAYDVLEHIADDAEVLRQLWQACRPGGGILLSVPQHAWLWSTADDLAHHHRRYTAPGLTRLVEAAGFNVVRTTSFNTLNLPFLMGRNWFLQTSGRAPEAAVPAGPLNWLLERLMDGDRRLIRAGWHLPAGGSLLLAARRPQQ